MGTRLICASALVIGALAATASAQQQLIASDRLEATMIATGREEAIPLVEERLTVAIDGQHATTTLVQVFQHRNGGQIEKTYRFADYHETIGFVNALAWIANREDHHPDLAVSYNRCVVAWSTHDAGGVTDNDIVSAAKTERLLAG